jgi:hypothetical protein
MCEQIFDEDEDRWRVIQNCDDPNCASSSTYSAAKHQPSKAQIKAMRAKGWRTRKRKG